MPRRDPDHNSKRVNSLVETQKVYTGDRPEEHAFYELLTAGVCPIEAVEEAYELYLHPENRHIMSALILCKATDQQISDSLSMSLSVIAAFRHLFFDRSVFRHDLDAKDYVNDLQVSPEVKLLYTTGNTKGFRRLANTFHIGEKAAVSPREVAQELMNDQLDRAISHRGHAITSEIARECLNWGRAALASAAMLMRTDAGDEKSVLDQLKIALRVEDNTKTIEDLDIKTGELYH